MKKIFYLLIFPLCMGMAACSKDNPSDDSPMSNLSETQRKFLGFWHCNNERIDFLFNADGTCHSYSQAEYTDSENKSGEWTYNETTKTLSTTIDGYQWVVTLSSDKAWSGVTLNGNGTRSYVRSDLYHLWCVYLSTSKWQKKDGSDYMDFSLRNLVINSEDEIIISERSGILSSNLYKFVFDDGYKQWLLKESSDIYNGIGLREESITTTGAQMVFKDCKYENGQFVANVTQTVYYDYFQYYYDETTGRDELLIEGHGEPRSEVTMTLKNPDSKDATLVLEGITDKSFKAEYVLVQRK